MNFPYIQSQNITILYGLFIKYGHYIFGFHVTMVKTGRGGRIGSSVTPQRAEQRKGLTGEVKLSSLFLCSSQALDTH